MRVRRQRPDPSAFEPFGPVAFLESCSVDQTLRHIRYLCHQADLKATYLGTKMAGLVTKLIASYLFDCLPFYLRLISGSAQGTSSRLSTDSRATLILFSVLRFRFDLLV